MLARKSGRAPTCDRNPGPAGRPRRALAAHRVELDMVPVVRDPPSLSLREMDLPRPFDDPLHDVDPVLLDLRHSVEAYVQGLADGVGQLQSAGAGGSNRTASNRASSGRIAAAVAAAQSVPFRRIRCEEGGDQWARRPDADPEAASFARLRKAAPEGGQLREDKGAAVPARSGADRARPVGRRQPPADARDVGRPLEDRGDLEEPVALSQRGRSAFVKSQLNRHPSSSALRSGAEPSEPVEQLPNEAVGRTVQMSENGGSWFGCSPAENEAIASFCFAAFSARLIFTRIESDQWWPNGSSRCRSPLAPELVLERHCHLRARRPRRGPERRRRSSNRGAG